MPAEDLRSIVNDLKADVNNALGRIERTIESMRKEFREDFVTRREFDAVTKNLESDVNEIKSSTRWRIGTVLIPTMSLLVATAAVVVSIFVR